MQERTADDHVEFHRAFDVSSIEHLSVFLDEVDHPAVMGGNVHRNARRRTVDEQLDALAEIRESLAGFRGDARGVGELLPENGHAGSIFCHINLVEQHDRLMTRAPEIREHARDGFVLLPRGRARGIDHVQQ